MPSPAMNTAVTNAPAAAPSLITTPTTAPMANAATAAVAIVRPTDCLASGAFLALLDFFAVETFAGFFAVVLLVVILSPCLQLDTEVLRPRDH